MAESKHQPLPWRQGRYGEIKDANGERVRLAHVSLATGCVREDDPAYGNEALILAALAACTGTPPAALTPGLVEELRREVERLRAALEQIRNYRSTFEFGSAEDLVEKLEEQIRGIRELARAALKGETDGR